MFRVLVFFLMNGFQHGQFLKNNSINCLQLTFQIKFKKIPILLDLLMKRYFQ